MRPTKEPRLFIYDRHNNHKFLVDSGSVLSIVPNNWIYPARSPSPDSLVLFAANSSTIKTFGTRFLKLNLSLRRNFDWEFTVADVTSAILGADFMTHFGLYIDLRGQRLIDPMTSLSTKGQVCETLLYNVSTVSAKDNRIPLEVAQLLLQFPEATTPAPTFSTVIDSVVSHHITTTGPPVAEEPRRLSGLKLQCARDEFNRMQTHGIIRPSRCQWASPLHLVPKKDGT